MTATHSHWFATSSTDCACTCGLTLGDHLAEADYAAERLAWAVEEESAARGAVLSRVVDARLAGCSWSTIAQQVGMTKQGAQQRYGRMTEALVPLDAGQD